MSIHRNLMTVCFAAVFALGLAACSSSSDDPPATGGNGTDMPDPAIAERAAINSAIMAARTAVAGLTDDASDPAINAAEMAVAAAKKAVMDAANVPDTEKAAFNTTVATLEGNLAAKKTSIMTAREAADDAMKAAMAKTGKALHAALGATPLANIAAPSLTSAGLAIDAADGAGSFDTGTDPASVTLTAGDSAGSLGSWMGMDYMHTDTGTKVVNAARVYNNKGPGKRVSFAAAGHTVITTDGADKGYLAVDGTSADAVALVMATAFTHSGTQSHPIPDRSNAFYTRGTYDGAPGEYRCTGTCSSTNDGKGSPSELTGVLALQTRCRRNGAPTRCPLPVLRLVGEQGQGRRADGGQRLCGHRWYRSRLALDDLDTGRRPYRNNRLSVLCRPRCRQVRHEQYRLTVRATAATSRRMPT